jgi:TolB protein
MDPSSPEKDLKRISFVGQFNATPRFSPDGKEIVFTSWVDRGFDLYRISADGNNLSRLTKNFGSNEEPAFSPDGEFIIFSSKTVNSARKATQDLYIMNREGEILGQLTQGFGQCASPQWSNLLK